MNHSLAKGLNLLRGIGMGMQQKGYSGVRAGEVFKEPSQKLNLTNPSGPAVVDQKQAAWGHGAFYF